MNHIISVNQAQVKYNWNLEGLRGGLALIVGLAHIFGISNLLDPEYHINWHWLNAGHITVLVFFVMSGYVIGLTCPKTKRFSQENAIKYLIKRSIRLFPIYIIALFLGMIARPNFSMGELLGNLLFLQNIIVPGIDGNSPVWSLGYEVFYYFLFLFIWRFKVPLYPLLAFAITLSFLGAATFAIPEWIYGYACGFVFWLGGLILAWKTQANQEQNINLPIISYLCLFYCIANFKLGDILLEHLNLNRHLAWAGVTLSDVIGLLPICILFICLVAQRDLIYLQFLKILCFTMPVLITVYLLLAGRLLEDRWLPSAIFLLISIMSIKLNLRLSILSKLSFFGSISYGFYLVHFPILIFVQKYFPFSGSIISFLTRFVVWFLLSISFAYLLEKIMQPKIKKWCYQQSLFKVAT